MFGEKIIKHCSYCNKDIVCSVSTKFINKDNGEIYYGSLICPNCRNDISDIEKIHQNKNKCIAIMV